ncbi:MAG: hypothetical protein QJR08_03635 [Bacillota bacterium]|nr:hypothetical protein [Bacillota bacterium]
MSERAPRVLTVVLQDLGDVERHLAWFNEVVPPRYRTVRIELTPEQRAQLEPRVTASFQSGGFQITVRERIHDCWFEPEEASADAEPWIERRRV